MESRSGIRETEAEFGLRKNTLNLNPDAHEGQVDLEGWEWDALAIFPF